MENVRKFDEPFKRTLNDMQLNDVFNYPSLGPVAFKRWKQGHKSFEAISLREKKQYSCRCSLGTAMAEYEVIGMYTPPVVANDIDKLQKDDLFVIPQRNDAVLLKFIEFKRSGKIVACNPLNPTMVFTVDKSFKITLVKNLK